MTKFLVDIDEKTLAVAAEVLGTDTKKATLNTALHEVAEQIKRARAFDELVEMGKTGYFDELLDKKNYRA